MYKVLHTLDHNVYKKDLEFFSDQTLFFTQFSNNTKFKDFFPKRSYVLLQT